MKTLARSLRHQMTDAEHARWQHLRAHRFSGYKFRRQLVIEPYIVDFVCLRAKLVVEADGGQHGEQRTEDCARTTYLERLGYHVLRFWNHEILTETHAVLEKTYSELVKRSPLPNPYP